MKSDNHFSDWFRVEAWRSVEEASTEAKKNQVSNIKARIGKKIVLPQECLINFKIGAKTCLWKINVFLICLHVVGAYMSSVLDGKSPDLGCKNYVW